MNPTKQQRQFIFFALLLALLLSPLIMVLALPQPVRITAPIEYVVREGDTCSEIGSNYQVGVVALIKTNNLDRFCTIIAGQKIIIPASDSAEK